KTCRVPYGCISGLSRVALYPDNPEHMRIGILGMGGIGGFVGAKLARAYSKDRDTQIIFICRGKTKEKILHEGLKFISPKETVTVHPDLTSDDPLEIGLLDLLIVATKSYALADAVR